MTEIKSVLRGAAPMTAMEFCSLALALITQPYLMRVLGPSGFGRYAVGVAICGVIAGLVDYGFNQLGPREVARAPATGTARASLFWTLQLAKVWLALLVLIVLAAAVWFLGLHAAYGAVVIASFPNALSTLLFPQWYLQGLQHFRALALSLACARMVVSGATLLAVTAPEQAPLAVLFQALTGCCAGLFAMFDKRYVRSLCGAEAKPWSESWRYLRQGRSLFLSTAAVSMYTISVPILVGIVSAPAAVGLYSVGDRIRAAVQTLLAPIGAAAFPKFSVWMTEDRSKALVAARHMMALQIGLGAAAAAVIVVLAEPVVRTLLGVEFLPAVPVAELLAVCIIFTGASNTLGMQMMLPLGMERAYLAILGVSGAVGIVAVVSLSAVLGAMGAALALVSTEALVAALMAICLKRGKVL